MSQNFFPSRPDIDPKIYAYITPGVIENQNFIKIGYTERDPEKRVKEQTQTAAINYKILLIASALRPDGSTFTDKDVHKVLARKFIRKNEWFKCTLDDVKAAIIAVKTRKYNILSRTQDFKLRPEQTAAINKTMKYFADFKSKYPDQAPKFLWNAKMRFGKTFAAYELCRLMGLRKILVLTFKPVVESAWSEDALTHINFDGWQFISNARANDKNLTIDEDFSRIDLSRPVIVFGSFQDLLGKNKNGGIKTKNEFIHSTEWDIIIFDEYHYGAWRDNAKKLFTKYDDEAEFLNNSDLTQDEADNLLNESFLPIKTKFYLYLSGTPFRALNSGEFIEEQIYSWTYSDEQQAKESWPDKNNNPYEALPRVIMMTYQMPDEIREIAQEGELNEFDLNKFFAVKESERLEDSEFINADYVQKWLNLIRGSYFRAGTKSPPMPFSDRKLLQNLRHTLWFLPNVASCYAMHNLLTEDNFFKDYRVIICAGTQAGVGLEALPPVLKAIDDPFKTKSITLSCGKLTTGVTVKAWTGVFMLRNLQSPETYFQTAFRVQSPFTVPDNSGRNIIIKEVCYIFDFALERALKQVSDYSCRLNLNEDNPEKKVSEFIKFLPVLAYDGSSMRQINAQDILDIAMSGTSATLLARRWESALLVNVDNETLKRVLNNPDAMKALNNIEAFRNLNRDIEIIINKSEHIKRARTSENPINKQELTQEEKEIRDLRKKIREKLIKFAARIPIFMYLTDLRERTLKDIITQLTPGLFHKVTGLNVSDFDLLCGLGVFNSRLMNDAIFKFKRYEDASLTYTGLNRHDEEQEVGGFDESISREIFYNQPIYK